MRDLLKPLRGRGPSGGRPAGRRCWSCAASPMRCAICSPAARSAASTRWILRALGARTGRRPGRRSPRSTREYLDILDWQGAVDYSGLVRRTARLLGNPEVLGEVAGDLRLIVVDEYQDTDPAQELVLRALAATRAQLVVVGDPDQSIYGFRGRGRQRNPELRRAFPRPAPPARAGARARAVPAFGVRARRCVAGGRVPASAAGAAGGGGRPSPPACSRSGPGPEGHPAVAVRVFSSPAQEAVAVADALRRAHLIDGVPWSSMAVLVRSTRLAGPLQRALADAGVPVETPADERPLTREPVLEPLLALLHAGAGLRPLDEDTAVALLCSPLGGADALDIRRLRRALARARAGGGRTRRSGELLVECLRDPAAGEKPCSARGFRLTRWWRRRGGSPGLLARVRRGDRGGRNPRRGAVGGVVGKPLAGGAGAPGAPARAARPPGAAASRRPPARRGRRALRSRGALHRPAARRRARGLPERAAGAGDSGRSAEPAQLHRRRGAAADGSPFQGPGVGVRRRRRGAGGRLAGSAAAQHPAGG